RRSSQLSSAASPAASPVAPAGLSRWGCQACASLHPASVSQPASLAAADTCHQAIAGAVPLRDARGIPSVRPLSCRLFRARPCSLLLAATLSLHCLLHIPPPSSARLPGFRLPLPPSSIR